MKPEMWHVQFYDESIDYWFDVIYKGHSRWPLAEALRVMKRDYDYWKNQFVNEYQVRLFNPDTGEVIPREAL